MDARALSEGSAWMEFAAAVYSLYLSNTDITEIVTALKAVGFRSENICLFLASSHLQASALRNVSLQTEASGKEAKTAHPIAPGQLDAVGAIVIPRTTFLIRSQAFLRPFAEAALPADVSKLLLNLGLCEQDSQRFTAQLQKEGFLIYLLTANMERAKWAMEILRLTGASEAGTLERIKKAKKAGAAA